MENALRAALNRVGAAALSELLQFEVPAPDQRQLSCSRGTAVQIGRECDARVSKVREFSGSRVVCGLKFVFLLSKLLDQRKWPLLGGGRQYRWWLEGLVEPLEPVAVGERLLAQQGGQIGQAPAEAGAQLQVLEHEQSNQRGPDLDLQGVGSGADEGLDAQVLPERLEEQLDLPAAFVDLGDGGGGEVTMVGEKDQSALLGLVPHRNAAQEQIGSARASHLIEKDDFVALERAALGNRAALHDAVVGVVFPAVTK